MRHPFLRSAGSELKDPNFKNVTLLLHGDGTNGGQNNTFVDGSTNNFTITRNGNTTQGTFSPYGDNWSNYFDGTGDSLTCASNAAFSIGTGQFTIEFWIQFSSLSNIQEFIRTALSDINYSFVFYYTTSNFTLNIGPYAGVGGGGISVSWTPNRGQWYHLAASRDSSNTQRLFIDGVLVGSSTSTVSYIQSGFGIFQRFANFNGYVSNLRFVNGTAIYTANFTVPTAPLTAVTNTVLLTCQSNRFRDASTNNFTITRNGDVSVQRFSPFSPTAAYAAGTIGGSGYFDGTGDYLQLTGGDGFNLTGDFTVEAWIYRTTSGSQRIVGKWNLTGNLAWVLETSTTAIGFGVANSGTFSASLSFSATINLFAWNHVAVSRSGSTVRAFLNGVDLGSATSSANCTANNTNPIQIGQTENVNYVNGYVCDVRVLKGTAQYTAAFTPPTAPLTAITNTSLLLNFTNAAILDNAMMAVPETVGNAQIDTTIKKFGTGSIKFDGTGDWLLVPNSSVLTLGVDFTIEAWIYVTAGGANRGVVTLGNRNTTTGISLFWESSTAIKVFSNSAEIVGTSAILSLNTWAHIALVRNGTGVNNLKIYVNGVMSGQNGTGNNTAFAGTAANGVCVGASYNGSFVEPYQGYIDDLRITNGVARYTTNFTPPTAPFPNL